MKTYNHIEELLDEYSGSFYQFGRSLYKGVACGPWCRLLREDGSDIYYESDKANELLVDHPTITGLEIGSIVEGSDVEVGPILLEFPFTDKELWDAVEEINAEATFYWDRDNTDDYMIEVGGETYYLTSGWGFEFPEDTPEHIKTFIENYWDVIEQIEDGEEVEISDHKVTKMDKSVLLF